MKNITKHKNKGLSSISALQTRLFNELDAIKDTRALTPVHIEHSLESEYTEQGQTCCTNPCIQTYSNKGKIERMKKEINRLREGQGSEFVTGVGLFQQQIPQYEPRQPVNAGNMLRNLTSSKVSDLEELRRMIKKTENNLRGYSQSVYKTQTKVLSAADKIGEDIETGLAIKINRCNLGQMFQKRSKPQTASSVARGEAIRRRTMTAYNPRRTRAMD